MAVMTLEPTDPAARGRRRAAGVPASRDR